MPDSEFSPAAGGPPARARAEQGTHDGTSGAAARLAATTMSVYRFMFVSQSVFFVAFLDAFGRSNAETAGVFTVASVVYVTGTVTVGLFAAKVGPLGVIEWGVMLLVVGLVASALSPGLPAIYVSFGVVVAIGTTMTGLVPTASLLSEHFHSRRGAAMGLAFFIAGLATFVLVPLVQAVNDRASWRWSLLGIAVLTAVAVLPAVRSLRRRSPQGVRAFAQSRPTAPGGVIPRLWRAPSPSALRAWLAEPAFGWLVVAHVNIGLSIGAVLVPLVAHLQDRGLPTSLGASALAMMVLVTAAGSLGGGRISDTAGRELTYTLASALRVAGIVALLFITLDRSWLLVPFVVLFGLGWGSSGPLEAAVASDLFPGRGLATRLGTLEAVTSASYGLAVFIVSLGRDRLGTYEPALWLSMVSAGLAAAAYWGAAPRRVR